MCDFETAWNSTYMRNVRKQMLNGEIPSCIKCFKEEAAALIVNVYGKHIIGVRELM